MLLTTKKTYTVSSTDPITNKAVEETKHYYVNVEDLAQTGQDAEWFIKSGFISRLDAKVTEKFWAFASMDGGGYGTGQINNRQPINEWQLIGEFANNPTVYACVEKNSTKVATTPWHLYKIAKDDGKTTKSLNNKSKRLSKSFQAQLRSRIKLNAPTDAEIVEVINHPFIDLLNKDNEDLNGFQLLKVTEEDLEIYGRSYWLIDQDDDGNDRITSLRPQSMIPLRDPSGYVVSYYYFNFVEGYYSGSPTDPKGADLSRAVSFDRDQIIDFRWVTAFDRYGGGISPLRGAFRAVMVSSQYTEWLNAILSNRQRPDFLVSPKTDNMDPDEKTRLETEFGQRNRGKRNGKPLITSSSVTVTPLSYDPIDIAPLEIAAQFDKDIYAAFQIPSALMDSDAATYSNYESALEDWARGGINPRLTMLTSIINQSFDKLGYEDDGTFFAFDEIIPEDKEFALKERMADEQIFVAAMKQGAVSIDDIRARLGLEPLPNGQGNDLVKPTPPPTPFGQAPQDANDANDSKQGDGDDATASGKDKEEGEQDGEDAKGKAFDYLLKINSKVAKGILQRAVAINMAAHLGFDKSMVGFPIEHKSNCKCVQCKPKPTVEQKEAPAPGEQTTADKIKRVVSGWFGDLKSDALKTIKKSADVEDIRTKADTGNLPQEFTDIDDWINDLKGTDDDLAYKVKPLIELEAQKSADGKGQYLGRVGASPDAFDVVPAKVEAASDKRSYKFAKSTLTTTQKTLQDAVDQVKQAITDGTLSGSSVNALTDAISAVFENAQDFQAERIARTETAAAVTSGQVIAAKASGIVKGFKYLVSADACDKCQDYAGDTVDIDDYDDSGEVDADGAVPLHPNCTCTIEEILNDPNEGDNDNQ